MDAGGRATHGAVAEDVRAGADSRRHGCARDGKERIDKAAALSSGPSYHVMLSLLTYVHVGKGSPANAPPGMAGKQLI